MKSYLMLDCPNCEAEVYTDVCVSECPECGASIYTGDMGVMAESQ